MLRAVIAVAACAQVISPRLGCAVYVLPKCSWGFDFHSVQLSRHPVFYTRLCADCNNPIGCTSLRDRWNSKLRTTECISMLRRSVLLNCEGSEY